MSQKNKVSNNLSLALVFIAVVIFFVAISLLFKVFFIFKNSHFDGGNKYNLEIIDSKQTQILSFSPKENSISILKLDKKVEGDLSKNLEVPIDGIINLNNYDFNSSKISTGLFHSLSGTKYKITSLDILRLILFSRKVSGDSVYVRKFNEDYTSTQKFNVLYLTFKDPVIFTQNQTIEIINATDVFGLGNRLATMISAIGGNVIFVKSEEDNTNSKILYNDKETYTIERIKQAINFPSIETKDRGVADVIITIGKDSLKNLNF